MDYTGVIAQQFKSSMATVIDDCDFSLVLLWLGWMKYFTDENTDQHVFKHISKIN